jgi:hypothetical protein
MLRHLGATVDQRTFPSQPDERSAHDRTGSARPCGDCRSTVLPRRCDEGRDRGPTRSQPVQGRPLARRGPCHGHRPHRARLAGTPQPRPVSTASRGVSPSPLHRHGRSRGRRPAASDAAWAGSGRTGQRDRRTRRCPGLGLGSLVDAHASDPHAPPALRRGAADRSAGVAPRRESGRARTGRGTTVGR